MRFRLSHSLNVVDGRPAEKYSCRQTSSGSIKADLTFEWRRIEKLLTLKICCKRTCRLNGDRDVNRQQRSNKGGEVGPTSQQKPYAPLLDGLLKL
jgi:hypothetical protein